MVRSRVISGTVQSDWNPSSRKRLKFGLAKRAVSVSASHYRLSGGKHLSRRHTRGIEKPLELVGEFRPCGVQRVHIEAAATIA